MYKRAPQSMQDHPGPCRRWISIAWLVGGGGGSCVIITPAITAFICRDMRKRTRDEFSILLSTADAVRVFGEKIKLSHIVSLPQEHLYLCLIINLSVKHDK